MENFNTLEDAKQHLRNHWTDKSGVSCPCCSQHVQLYLRPLTSAMIHGLILLSKASDEDKTPEGYIHTEDYFKKIDCPSSVRGDVSKLRFWGFISPKPGKRDDGSSRNGFYKVLPAGLEFIKGHSEVRKRVKVFNNKTYGFEGDMVHVKDVIKKKFNYEKLMEGVL